MALPIAGLQVSGGGLLHRRSHVRTNLLLCYFSHNRPLPSPNLANHPWSPPISVRHIRLLAAAKKLSSITGKFDSKNKRISTTTTNEDETEENKVIQKFGQIDTENLVIDGSIDYGFVVPDLPGEQTDLWEGPQWDGLGFFVQYLWAFGILFALIACGTAVSTYNEGASDFKDTPSYKESIQSRELFEEDDGSSLDVFESNPTQEAPALE
ncbi:uncharacterized protein LOC124932963 [Impatiens glandulifera]|uniref:uncharacterized protein LOC124932963 n=1 Tax=Impatiens glandulifera TaxID=253017 RepID=UPI001FB0C0EF|nr:uncharacterized protein LOC124932963 [Impatiens glandulifera]